jgi:ATP-dependent Clp protease ATP-binding subunit ClpC
MINFKNFKINELKEDKEKVETTLLDSIGRDLTELAKENKFDPTIGRVKEIDEVVAILARRRKNNPVLIGDPGVGKTAIVEGIAQIISNSDDCPETLKGKRIIEVDMATIMAGTSNQGDLEKRVKRIIKELEDNPDVIVFIDEIHMIVDSNKPIDVSNMFKPALARGEMRCIGATTEKEYKIIEKDSALERRFQKVSVGEPTQEETIEILKRLKDNYGKYHGVEYTDDAVVACVKLAGRYITDRFFPDKAIDLLDEVGARMRVRKTKSKELKDLELELHKIGERKNKLLKSQKFEEAGELRKSENEIKLRLEDLTKGEDKIVVDKKDVESVMSKKLDLPELKSDDEDVARKYLELSDKLKMDVIGQDEAVAKVSKLLRRNAAGLKDPNRPSGVFLFLGSTGVGKTHLVKTLAKNIFGSESAMIRLDMSEYGEKHNVARLIGSPPGYVGYGEGGQLTEKVRRKPYSIILLDELEKAHPDVLNVLLQVFEDGHLTDGQGKKVDFKNTIIIMTSNIGARVAAETARTPVGFSGTGVDKTAIEEETAKETIKKELRKALAPEFLNRIDDIIIFSKLSKESIYKIIDVELAKVRKKLDNMGYTLEITDNLKDLLIEKGYDSSLGARPLKRAIVKYIEDPISEEILRKTITDKIVMDYDKDSNKVLINGNQIIEKSKNVLSWKLFNIK